MHLHVWHRQGHRCRKYTAEVARRAQQAWHAGKTNTTSGCKGACNARVHACDGVLSRRVAYCTQREQKHPGPLSTGQWRWCCMTPCPSQSQAWARQNSSCFVGRSLSLGFAASCRWCSASGSHAAALQNTQASSKIYDVMIKWHVKWQPRLSDAWFCKPYICVQGTRSRCCASGKPPTHAHHRYC